MKAHYSRFDNNSFMAINMNIEAQLKMFTKIIHIEIVNIFTLLYNMCRVLLFVSFVGT